MPNLRTETYLVGDSVSMSDELPEHANFTNEDGTPATWIEQLSQRARLEAFAVPFGISLAIAITLWTVQYLNNAPNEMYAIALIGPIAGAGIGIGAYSKATRRRFSIRGIPTSHSARLFRAFLWIIWSLATIFALSLWMPPLDASSRAWWHVGSAAVVLFPGIALYLWNREARLTPRALAAKVYFDHLARQPTETIFGKVDLAISKFFEKPAARYTLAVLFLGGAYYFTVINATPKDATISAIVCAGIAGALAREAHPWFLKIGGWVLGAGLWAMWTGLTLLLIWWAFVGVSAIPVSAAIIIGALIIAAAVKR